LKTILDLFIMFAPAIKKINEAWHQHFFKCLFHSDGYLMDIMDDLIETGIDGLNPIETTVAMSIKNLKNTETKFFLQAE